MKAARTTKAQRRFARRHRSRWCRAWGTARGARLIARGLTDHQAYLADKFGVPPEVLIGPHVSMWDLAEPDPGTVAYYDALGTAVAEDITRRWLRPRLAEAGLDPADYAIASA